MVVVVVGVFQSSSPIVVICRSIFEKSSHVRVQEWCSIPAGFL